MSLSTEAEDLRKKAEEIIENYALYHAGTAFVVGNLGGQFGADRIALTALTVKMITEICDLYGIKDIGARGVHIASAIGRLTVRGTVIASTILNWVPFVGPAANSATTYYLTRKAGRECVNDIEKDRMTGVKQLTFAGGRIIAGQLAGQIYDAASEATDIIVDGYTDVVDNTCDELIKAAEAADLPDSSNALHEIKEILDSNPVIDIEKKLVNQTLYKSAMNTFSGEDTDLRSMMKRSLIQAVFVAAIDLDDEFLYEHRASLQNQLEIYRQILPDTKWNALQVALNNYNNSSVEDRKEAFHKLVKAIEISSTISEEATHFFKSLCTRFTCTRFREGLIPFDDGGLDQIRHKLAFIVYESGFSKNSSNNWEVSERLLWSNEVSQALLAHIRNISTGFDDNISGLETAVKITLTDWNYIPDTESFVSQCTKSILNDEDLICAFTVRSLLIKSYVEHCKTAAYGIHLHVSAGDQENWLFSEAFSRELLKLSFETKVKVESLGENRKFLEEVLKRTINSYHLQSYAAPSYQQLLDENLFVNSTIEMAKLLAADSEPLTTG